MMPILNIDMFSINQFDFLKINYELNNLHDKSINEKAVYSSYAQR